MKATGRYSGIVAIVLAVGFATAINCFTFAVLYDSIHSDQPGLSENATQILTTAFGGIIGVLGGYMGFRAGEQSRQETARAAEAGEADPDTPPEP